MSSIDLDFLKYMKYMPDKYLQTIEQLKLKTMEFDNLQSAFMSTMEKIKALNVELEKFKRRSDACQCQYYKSKNKKVTEELRCARTEIEKVTEELKKVTKENEQLKQERDMRSNSARLALASGPSSWYHYNQNLQQQPGHGHGFRHGDHTVARYGGYRNYNNEYYSPHPNSQPQHRPTYIPRDNRSQLYRHARSRTWTASASTVQRRSPSPPHLKPYYRLSPSPPPSLPMLTDGREPGVNVNPEYPAGPVSLVKIKEEPMECGETDARNQLETNAALVTVKKEVPDGLSLSGFKENDDVQDGFAQLAAANQLIKFPVPHPHEFTFSQNFGVDNDLPDDTDIEFRQRLNSTYFTPQHQHDLLKALEDDKKYSLSQIHNPVLNHYLVVVINDNSKSERLSFYGNLKNYLEKFGKNVYYFIFSSEMDVQIAVWYQRVRELLRLMPNLKRIKLEICPSAYDQLCSDEELQDLQDTCKRIHPFPVLEQLVSIDFQNLPYSVLEAALRNNENTIEKLQVSRTVEMGNWKDFCSISMKHLNEFSMTFYGMDEVFQLQFINWPLKSLIIRLQFEMKTSSPNYGEPNDFAKLFKILERFSETLTSLKLTVFQVPPSQLRLCLPKLEKLDVYFAEDASLNFLLELKALNELKVHLQRERKDMADDLIKFNGYIDCMRKSNIWELVPSLMQLEMTTYFDGAAKTYFDRKPNAEFDFPLFLNSVD